MPKQSIETNDKPKVEPLALSELTESKLNPRKEFKGLDELAASIKAQGILQPLVVRKNGKGYEIVCGHRRFRAAKLAKVREVPAVIREFASDEEVLAAQITENCMREDVHPMEEAEAYSTLHETGHSVAKIASSVGKSESYVYKRLQLCALSMNARKAFLNGEILVGVAYLIARMPTHEVQDEALEDVLASTSTEAATTKEMARHIERSYMLRLAEAPFSRTDAKLLPDVGACTACPKRTGNQPSLFDDVKSKDICTDPACFKIKTDANWKRAAERARSRGLHVLSDSDARKVYRYGAEQIACGSKYVDPRDPHPNDPESRSWKKLLGKQAPPSVLCRNPRGKPVNLIERKAATKILKDMGLDFEVKKTRSKKPAAKAKKEKADMERQETCKLALQTAQEVLRRLVEQVLEHGVRTEVWRHILMLIFNAYNGPPRDDDDKRFDAMNDAFSSDNERVLQAAIADLVLWQSSDVARFQGERPHELEALAIVYDIDYDDVEREVKLQLAKKGKRYRGRK